jgi:hypothetical protein
MQKNNLGQSSAGSFADPAAVSPNSVKRYIVAGMVGGHCDGGV